MSGPKLLVLSHRGPAVFQRRGGRVEAQRGGGGLVGSLVPVMDRFGGTWIASALSEEDHRIAREEPAGRDEGGYRLRFLDLPERQHYQHYDLVSNETLWFVFHYLYDLPHAPAFGPEFLQAWQGYREVNRVYAQAVLEAGRADAVLVQDYHLMLVAEHVRRRRRRGPPLVYFHHTPWAEPDYFSLLPAGVREEILRSMLCHDVVGFHASRWARSFAACCARFLGAETGGDRIAWRGRETRLLVAPVPLDVARLRGQAAHDAAERWREKFVRLAGDRTTILRVDRVEMSKNVLRGFLAFETLLERCPDLVERVWFLALLYPSRPRVAEYRRYLGECLAAVRRINERFARPGGEGPIGLFVHDEFHRSLGGMRMADVLMVNPVFDGLNLVAKEGPITSDRDLVVVLSRNAGVFEEMQDAALAVNPFDVSETAATLERAIAMPPAERARRAAKLRRLASSGTPEGWVRGQLRAAGVNF